MFLCDRDLVWAIQTRDLIVDPAPGADLKGIGPTSIDLHLDSVKQAKVWNLAKFKERGEIHGQSDPLLPLGSFKYEQFATEYHMPPREDKNDLVYRDGSRIIVKPHGFLLWQTKELVGTPEEGARLICFVEGRSKLARTGLVVHMTAPTIHAGWGAWNITLEISNLGPFHFVLQEGDAIAQLTVATISNIPARNMRESGSETVGQTSVGIKT
jgi:dCTP deaminase